MSDVVIVGGGISGILLALKLSKQPSSDPKKIVLLEEKNTLGGRFFYSQSNHQCSGPGFEIWDRHTQESLFDFLLSCLHDEEKQALNQKLNFSESLRERSRLFFVKKELTNSDELVSESSEVFTKKEALILNSLVDENEPLESKTKTWNELSKANKDAFVPIIETLTASETKDVSLEKIFRLLADFFSVSKKLNFNPFFQSQNLEQWLEQILIDRGVEIRKQCKVLRLSQSADKSFSLLLSDEKNPACKEILSKNVVFAIPLVRCAGIMPKEFYAAEQSRFISRVRPLSLVVVEMPDFLQIKSDALRQEFYSGDQFVFPVERVRGFLTSDFRILFFTLLPYENSLQAPAVREAVARLRRAAARILKPSVSEEQRRGPRMPQHKVTEKIILMPVAHAMPYDMNVNFDLKQVKMGLDGLYCCGDSFHSLGSEPWQRVIHSVDDVVRFLRT